MEEAVCINDYGQGCASDGDCLQIDQLDNMDFTLASSFLELDEEDLSEIHRMVDEWEFNFGSLESSDGEELLRLVQIDNPSQFACPNPSVTAASINSPCQTEWRSINNEELHDRLPSYYTALAPSRSAPWIPPASQQVFNKLPAYITDIAPLDAADVATCGGSVGQPGKKKLNLAEYRTRREKQLQQIQEAEQQQKQEEEEDEEEEDEEQIEENKSNDLELADAKKGKHHESTDIEPVRVKVETDKTKSPAKESVKVKDEPEEGEVEEEEDDDDDEEEKEKKNAKVKLRLSRKETNSTRMRSSRSPTRSYSSESRSSSRRYRSTSSSSSSYSSRSRSRSPSYRRGRRRRRRSSRSPSWRRNNRRSSRRRTSRSPPPSRCSRGYGDRDRDRDRDSRSRRETERQRQIEERRVIYVGKLAEGTTRADLRQRFEPFGPVVDISLHFRERGDNYGFVTFAYKVDAYEAVEHGNDDPHLPKYDLSFGGRRAFCKETYADLDAVDDDGRSKANDVDFETLLRAVQVQLHRRPCS